MVFGFSLTSQQAYYTKPENLVGAYGMPLVEFQQYTTDRFFSIDQASHTRWEGWAIVDKMLNVFTTEIFTENEPVRGNQALFSLMLRIISTF